ncbi:glycosyltransferase [Microbacterium barkeri]|uniref:glycosyltransferase n=1 Tax=Microbacterium barkeri TaxID=33917 RepID=UPI0024AF593B|nr:glycosyltransferase [Microbacterium barkeri]MDI6943146.1 glycosyltransferase [Microbacterium barkeri]
MKNAGTVLVFPTWPENPYLNLLELAARAAGYRFRGATTHAELLHALPALPRGGVVHVHWTTPLVQEAADEADARDRLRRLLAALRDARRRGVRIVWTLHNRLPHELAHRDAEIGLYRALGKLTDIVHVMAPATPDVVSDVVALDPPSIRVIPHPSYEGIYDSGVDRAAARDSFELGAHDRAVLFLGQIRPYKGVDSLVSAARRAVADDPDLVLMLAGVVKDQSEEDFLRSIPEELRTITQFSFVPDGDLARWFRAADVAVFPYRAILNSGSLHLAATFRIPAILPDEPHLRAQFSDCTWIAFFDPARPAESIAELLADRSRFDAVTEADFAAFTDEISPWSVARRYRQLLDELSAAPSPALAPR